ncbi:hypothetical protein ASG87_01535 [Frateuria sp. Soil773]|uniref:ankyrin repeat domain-containing protein n=1 Tax=Frateuria sp. Soil773 TaxID=1736407 RepID=UPI0006F34380|nr:ankyrin repeat domain-containing protein [Frateuria sp. Soil773]KRE90846.1 hypothetical protein ASG87_01535 [Frateuria sp. Soil773]
MTAEQIEQAQAKLFQAAARGDVLQMRSALVAGAKLDAPRAGIGDTALNLAAAMGQEQSVVFLLEAGADPDMQNSSGRTALHEAAFLKTPAIWNRLIDAGASTDIVSVNGQTPISLRDTLAFGAAMVEYSQEQGQQAMGQPRERELSRGR